MKTPVRTRLLSALLSLVMLVSLLPVSVFAAEPASGTWEKVTEAQEDWSGQYLIVYEKGSLIMDGSLSALDKEGNKVDVTITDGKIVGDYAKYAFTIAPILQLAVSLDYSVFLIHRFAECRAENPDASPEECMVDALCRSTGSILSSGLTTVIGFLALVLMQFQIGPDLGLALAKGVVLSLVTVFTFMPALTLAAYQWMDKTYHRPLLPSFDKFGRFVARIMLPMALVLVILMVPSYLASNSNQYYYGAAHMFGENTRLGADTAAIEETFGRSDTYVVLVPEGDTATQQKLSDALHAIPEVTGILSYVDNAGASIPPEFVPGDTLGLLVSGGYTRMVLTVDADTEGDGAFALVERVRATVQQYYPDNYYLAGQGVSTYDLMDTITADMVKVNLLAIVLSALPGFLYLADPLIIKKKRQPKEA